MCAGIFASLLNPRSPCGSNALRRVRAKQKQSNAGSFYVALPKYCRLHTLY